MDCSCCGKQKNQIHAKKSDIINGVTLLMCQACIDAGYEPRWAIVLGGRQLGMTAVRDYILKHRYVGAAISAHELM